MKNSPPTALPRTAAVLGLVLVMLPVSGAGQPPAPVIPTVPAPRATRYQPPVPAGVVAQPGDNDKKDENGAKATLPELTLGECIAVAVEHQPALRAVQASQQATGAGYQALNNIGRLGSALSPDLPFRKQQSSRGVLAAAADVQKLHNELVHDVTRLYYTAVYARQQSQIAEDVVAQLELLVKIGRDLLKSPNPGDMTRAKLDAMEIGLAKAQRLHAKAQTGELRAYAALREAMGVHEATFPFRVKDKELPVMAQNIPLTKEQVVEMALCRRPELALAAAGADAFRLEVYAQGAIRFRRTVPTLGSGSDIHARLLPSGSRDPGRDYRPEPIAPEMPPQLIGNKSDRVTRALAYSQRADAVYEKARNLIELEAQDTYLNFVLAGKDVELGKVEFDRGRDLMERIRESVDNPKAPKDQLVMGYAEAARAQADYVEAVYQYLLVLAALERVTAGGVRPAFPGR
jgi:outer membrane protein TolC